MIAAAAFAGVGAMVAALREYGKPPPQRKRVARLDQAFDPTTTTTLNIRQRMHDAVGTGAEIGARVGVFPNDDGIQYLVPQGTLPKPPLLDIGEDRPLNAPTEVMFIPTLDHLDLGGDEPIEEKVDRAGDYDPNLVNPGQITVVPARLRPPADSEPPGPSVNDIQGVDELSGDVPVEAGTEQPVDWSVLSVDYEAARERVASSTTEFGDAVKVAAASAHAESLLVRAAEPTLEARVDTALTTLGPEHFKTARNATVAEAKANLQYAQKTRRTRPNGEFPDIAIRRIAAHRLNISHLHPGMVAVVRLVKEQQRTDRRTTS